MTNKQLFDHLMSDPDYTVKKSNDTKKKMMVISVYSKSGHPGEAFVFAQTYKGEKHTQSDIDKMYETIITYLCKKWLHMMAIGQALEAEGYTTTVINGELQ